MIGALDVLERMMIVVQKKIRVKKMKEIVMKMPNVKMIWFVVQKIVILNGMEAWILKLMMIVVWVCIMNTFKGRKKIEKIFLDSHSFYLFQIVYNWKMESFQKYFGMETGPPFVDIGFGTIIMEQHSFAKN